MTYYERHRDESLAYAAMVRAAYTEEDFKKRKDYYDKYWEQNKIRLCERQKLRRRLRREAKEKEAQQQMPEAPAPAPVPVAVPVVEAKPKRKRFRYPKGKGPGHGKGKVKEPKQYMITEKEPEPFGFENLNHAQKGVLKTIAPSGWYERPPEENPFVLNWS